MKKNHPDLCWRGLNTLFAEAADNLIQSGKASDEEEAMRMAFDTDIARVHWERFLETFGMLLRELNPGGHWCLDHGGYRQTMRYTSARDFVLSILPRCDLPFEVYIHNQAGVVRIHQQQWYEIHAIMRQEPVV
ncbi:MAG TPA: hypothetical protein ENJ91_10735 [Rhodobacteraceae bacterium]|nr:hypothetical protein [Paracoccaceae bacterium]